MTKITTALLALCLSLSTQAQNVGIGTTTPNYPLTLRTTNPAQPFGLVQTNGTDTAGLWVNSAYSWLGSITNKPFQIGANNLPNQFAILPNGNVGIGTTTPQAPFTVAPNKTVLFGADTLNGGTKMMWLPSKGAFRGGTLVDDASNIGTETDFWNTDSVGLNSFAFGINVKAKGNYSTATGIESTASGAYSTATGFKTSASGIFSTASGELSTASGFRSTASGSASTASGNHSTAPGNYSIASGDYSTASGSFSTASGGYSTASGFRSTASGSYSTASGVYSTAKSEYSTAIGRYNDTIVNSDPYNWVATDPLVTIGNGTSVANRHNALTIYKNGNQDIAGYTRLGEASEGAVRIKTKKLTGITTTADSTFLMLPHGLDASKILSISALVTDGSYQYLPHSPDAGAIYTVNVDGANIAIGVKTAANSSYVMGKPIKILITYEE